MILVPGLRRTIKGVPHEVEGLAHFGGHFYVSVCDRTSSRYRARVYRLDSRFRISEMRDVSFGTLEHAGGICEYEGAMLLPVAEYRPAHTRPSRLLLIERDLGHVETVAMVPDHVGGVLAVDDYIFLFNWDSRYYYVLNRDFKLVGKRKSPVEKMQDFARLGENLFMATIQGEDRFALLAHDGQRLIPLGRLRSMKGDSTNGIASLGRGIAVAWSNHRRTVFRKYKILLR